MRHPRRGSPRLQGSLTAVARDKQKPGGPRRWWRLLFVIPFVAMLWVPSYNRLEPDLAGIPFFYWYQLLWILLGALIVAIVYRADLRASRARGEDSDIDSSGVPGDIL
jgi:hypothetical protein